MASSHWTSGPLEHLDRGSLESLLDNRIPAIRLHGFASAPECRAFCAATRAGALRYYNVQPPVGYIGMAQYEYRWDRPKADYFADVAAANAAQRAVFAASFDAVARVADALTAAWGAAAGVAHEPGLGPYFAGIIRVADGGIRMHADYAPYNSPEYDIARIDAQIGWNIYFEVPEEGGDTLVLNAPWSPTMHGKVPPRSYDIAPEADAEVERFAFHPKAGELILFNVRNPHEVRAGRSADGRARISIGAFVGRLPEGTLVMWS